MQIYLTSFIGPMIDRILCVCQTKTESLKWVEHFRQQIKACRQPSLAANVSASSVLGGYIAPGGGVANPPPPPHVSLNHQPFELLTLWIRNSLIGGKLSREELTHMTKREYFSKSFQENHEGILSKDIKCIMRKEKKLLNRPNNKVECQIFSGIPKISGRVEKPPEDKCASYHITIENSKKEDTCEKEDRCENKKMGTNQAFDTESNKTQNDVMISEAIAQNKDSNSLNSIVVYDDDDDTITFLIPRKSFMDSEGGVSDGQEEKGNHFSKYDWNGWDHGDEKNPFIHEFDDDTSTLTGSHYGDDTSSLFHSHENHFGPWGKIFPNQQHANQLKTPTNSVNYCSCNIEDLYKQDDKNHLDGFGRQNSLPLNLGNVMHKKESVCNEEARDELFGSTVRSENRYLTEGLDISSNHNESDDDASLAYVDVSASETSSMCVPYLPPVKIGLSDFDRLYDQSKIYDSQSETQANISTDNRQANDFTMRESLNSSTGNEYKIPHKIREIRSHTPDREVLDRKMEAPYLEANGVDAQNIKLDQDAFNSLDPEAEDIYAQLEPMMENGLKDHTLLPTPDGDLGKKVSWTTKGIYPFDCHCFPSMKEFSAKYSHYDGLYNDSASCVQRASSNRADQQDMAGMDSNISNIKSNLIHCFQSPYIESGIAKCWQRPERIHMHNQITVSTANHSNSRLSTNESLPPMEAIDPIPGFGSRNISTVSTDPVNNINRTSKNPGATIRGEANSVSFKNNILDCIQQPSVLVQNNDNLCTIQMNNTSSTHQNRGDVIEQDANPISVLDCFQPPSVERFKSICYPSPEQDQLNHQGVVGPLHHVDSVEPTIESLHQSRQASVVGPTTPDILRHVPNPLPDNETPINQTRMIYDDVSQDEGMAENITSMHSARSQHLSQESNVTPSYHHESLLEQYSPNEISNYIDLDPQGTIGMSEYNRFACVQCSDQLSMNEHNKNVEGIDVQREETNQNNTLELTPNLNCLTKKKLLRKSKYMCVTDHDDDASDDIYGFTPNWPDDWNNTHTACHFPMSSLSTDIEAEHHKEEDNLSDDNSLSNRFFDSNEPISPLCNINKVLRDMPQHNKVFVTPKANSELYLECTMSARWLLVEKSQEKGFEISSGGSSAFSHEIMHPNLTKSIMHIQNYGEDKKNRKRILSTLV